MQRGNFSSNRRMTLSAVLLAGGESHRMGMEKATIIFQGEPLWQRQINLLRELQPQEIFVSARSERSWRPAGTKLVLDEAPSRGPLSGLAATLSCMQTDALIALAIDMPFMTCAHLQFLVSLATAGQGVLPMIGQRAEPLAAVYPREAHRDFVMGLKGNAFSLQSLSHNLVQRDKLRIFPVPENETKLYKNVNQPEDLAPN